MWPRFGLKNSLKVAANQAEINIQSQRHPSQLTFGGERGSIWLLAQVRIAHVYEDFRVRVNREDSLHKVFGLRLLADADCFAHIHHS
jgi:hypothetical protein